MKRSAETTQKNRVYMRERMAKKRKEMNEEERKAHLLKRRETYRRNKAIKKFSNENELSISDIKNLIKKNKLYYCSESSQLKKSESNNNMFESDSLTEDDKKSSSKASNVNEFNQRTNVDYDDYKMFKEFFSKDYKTVHKSDYNDFIKWKEIWYTDDASENQDGSQCNNENIKNTEEQNLENNVTITEKTIHHQDTANDSYIYESDDDVNSYINTSTSAKASLPLRAKKLPATRRLSISSSSSSSESTYIHGSINNNFDTEKISENMSKMMTKSSFKETYRDTSENETLMDFIKTKTKKIPFGYQRNKKDKYDNKKGGCS